MGKLSINGLIAADQVLVPFKVGALDRKALKDLHKTVHRVQEDEAPELVVAPAVMTSWDKSNYAGLVGAALRRDLNRGDHRSGPPQRPGRRGRRLRSAGALHPKATTTSDYDQLARLLLPVKGAAA